MSAHGYTIMSQCLERLLSADTPEKRDQAHQYVDAALTAPGTGSEAGFRTDLWLMVNAAVASKDHDILIGAVQNARNQVEWMSRYKTREELQAARCDRAMVNGEIDYSILSRFDLGDPLVHRPLVGQEVVS